MQVSWTYFTNGQPALLTVFYDTDNNASNGFHILTLIDTTDTAAPTRYSWDTTGMANGTYYLGAELAVGGTTIDSYAIGRVTITGAQMTQQYSLDQLGVAFKGCVFEGFSPAGNLGTVMAGRFDMLSETVRAGWDQRYRSGGSPGGLALFQRSGGRRGLPHIRLERASRGPELGLV